MATVRLLPYHEADGPWNMAADEALLVSAVAGVASLRFYSWSAATLSLGYFQPAGPARAYPGLAGLSWVRRPTGGAALVHHRELTYALALPAGEPWQPRGASWVVRMHGAIRAALAGLGVESRLCETERKLGEVLCFLHHTPGDLLIGSGKVAGSAQRKQRGVLLQHGGILLAQSAHTPELPGIAELSGQSISAEQLQAALRVAVQRDLGFAIHPGAWTEKEQEHILQLIPSRYASSAWNERR